MPPAIQKNYDTAKQAYQTNSTNSQTGWQFAHACFDRAEFSKDDDERASLANEGIAATRKVIAHDPNLAEGHYYLGLNLAQLARTKMLGALSIVQEMEREWRATLPLDEKIDYAGPDRYIGLLYRDAPGWPISVGDAAKARHHLLRAMEICPNFPENYLNMAESYLGWNEKPAAIDAVQKLHLVLPTARKEFVGDYWQPSWNDWNRRLHKLETKLNIAPASASNN